MGTYTLFLDESYDHAADVYVVGGVIIETERVAALSAAVSDVSKQLVGDKNAELKYTEDPAVRALLHKHGKGISDVRAAMAAVPATVGGITLVASIILDPTTDPEAGSLQPLTWAFLRNVTHFTNFLSDVRASTAAGSHSITADRFPNKKHQTAFHDAYRGTFEYVPYGAAPAAAGVLDFISEGDATYCPPLRLADHFAGTVRAWAMAERRYDAAPGPLTGKETGRPRYALNRYLPYVRGKRYSADQKGGFGLAIWPDGARPQLDLWLARTRDRREDEIYRGPSTKIITKADGGLVLSVDWGTPRSWE
jgi:hypothetical protein